MKTIIKIIQFLKSFAATFTGIQNANSKNSYQVIFKNCAYPNEKSIVIIPNSAGYYATHKEPFGKAAPHLDSLIDTLAQHHRIYYVILPGQNPEFHESKYSWTGSVQATKEALEHVVRNGKLVGVIGMCTGGAVAAQAMKELGLGETPLVLYNTALSVKWHIPEIQKIFLRKYGDVVRLDGKELEQNAPHELSSIISEHKGDILQIACHKSDYKIENQRELQKIIPKIRKLELNDMGDVPAEISMEYFVMIMNISNFFGRR